MVTLPVAAGTVKVTVSPTARVPRGITCAAGSAVGWGVLRRQVSDELTVTVAVPVLVVSARLVATTW